MKIKNHEMDWDCVRLVVLTVLAGLVLYFIGMKKRTRTYPNITVETVNILTGAEAIVRGEYSYGGMGGTHIMKMGRKP